MSSYNELVAILKELLTNRFYPKPDYIRGLLGDGQGNVLVPNRPDYNYVRFNRSSTEVFEVFNKEVSQPVDGWPVLIGEFPWSPGLVQVVGTDWAAYSQTGWGNDVASIQTHAPTHEWPNFAPGSDPVNVYLRAITPMRTQAFASGSSAVIVTAYEYDWSTGTSYLWPGVPPLSLGAAIPPTGSMRYMGVYLDPVTNTLGVVTGAVTVYTDALEPARPAWPRNVFPSAYVRLYGGQGQINERDIRDARRLWDISTMFTGTVGLPIPIVTGSYLGSLGGNPTWTIVSYLTAPDGSPNPSLFIDNSGDTNTVGDVNTSAGTDIFIGGDEAGVKQRGSFWRTSGIDDDFDGSALDGTWSWRGSPFVTPTRVNFDSASLVQIGHDVSTQRMFAARTDNLTSSFHLVLGAPNGFVDGAYFGWRTDDNSDNNYAETVIRKTTGTNTLELTSRRRTGGGAVTETVHQTIYNFPEFFIVGIQIVGTQWSNWGWSIHLGSLISGPATSSYSVVASGLTWTPSHRGIVFANAATTNVFRGPFIDKVIRF